MKKLNYWMIGFAVCVAISAVEAAMIYRSSNPSRPDTIVMPRDYYWLPLKTMGLIICEQSKPKLVLAGTAKVFVFPATNYPDNLIIITSDASLKESDIRKLVAPTTDDITLLKILGSLKPKVLVHLRRLKNNKIYMGMFKNKTVAWFDYFVFWKSVFDKEWSLLEEQVFKNDDEGEEINRKMRNRILKETYGMDCRINVQF